jgi:hypothetical protein
MNLAASSGDHALVALQHGWNLLALIRMDQQNDFIVTHERSLWIEPFSGQQQKPSTTKAKNRPRRQIGVRQGNQ